MPSRQLRRSALHLILHFLGCCAKVLKSLEVLFHSRARWLTVIVFNGSACLGSRSILLVCAASVKLDEDGDLQLFLQRSIPVLMCLCLCT